MLITVNKLKEAAETTGFVYALEKEIKWQEEHCTNKKKAQRAIAKYRADISHYQNQRNEVLASVEKINNLRIRTAIIMHYFNRASWRDVAQKIGRGDSEDSIRQAVYRFLDKEGEEYEKNMQHMRRNP